MSDITLADVKKDTARIKAERLSREMQEKEDKEQYKKDQEFLEQQSNISEKEALNLIHAKMVKERERALNLDESGILDKLQEIFCFAPTLTIDQMSPEEIVKHQQNLLEMINVIKIHIAATDAAKTELKKTRKKEVEEADRKYKVSPKNEPTVVSSKLNDVEKALWSLAKEYTDSNETSAIQDYYLKLKKEFDKGGMKLVKQYIEENED